MSKYQMGTLTVIVLVALRVGIGWHFFKEGAKKVRSPGFSAAGFLHQAKGPLAPYYQNLIPDQYGHRRLSRDSTLNDWDQYRNDAIRHYGFGDVQAKKANEICNTWKRHVSRWFGANREEINEYFHEVDRLTETQADSRSHFLSFRREWMSAKAPELRGKLNSLVSQVDAKAKAYQKSLYAIATPEQKSRGMLALPDHTKSWNDLVVKYGIFAIGVLLILGLFTRLASLAGALFLVSVMLTQPFWIPGSDLSVAYYQGTEFLALLLLAAVGAGRFAGLDLCLQYMRMGCCPPKRGNN